MDRRTFLQTAGLASIAAATLPGLALPALAEHDAMGFTFVAVNGAGEGPIDGVVHRVVLTANGTFNPSQVVASGTFTHFDGASGPPATIIASGTWRSRQLLRWESLGWYGNLGAGILEMEIDMMPQISISEVPPVIPATLKVVCNIGPAGLTTGEPEGFVLTIPGQPLPPFSPLTPPVGVTSFPRSNATG